eukprot:140731-Alexandrium_andersonii.AAC.1
MSLFQFRHNTAPKPSSGSLSTRPTTPAISRQVHSNTRSALARSSEGLATTSGTSDSPSGAATAAAGFFTRSFALNFSSAGDRPSSNFSGAPPATI